MPPIDDLEMLVEKLFRLIEAEFLVHETLPHMVSQIREIHDETVEEIRVIARGILAGDRRLGAAGPRVPMEVLERAFAALRFAAEVEWRRSMKLKGRAAKRSRLQSEKLAEMTHQAAVAMKVAAEAKGIWSADYASENGLESWL